MQQRQKDHENRQIILSSPHKDSAALHQHQIGKNQEKQRQHRMRHNRRMDPGSFSEKGGPHRDDRQGMPDIQRRRDSRVGQDPVHRPRLLRQHGLRHIIGVVSVKRGLRKEHIQLKKQQNKKQHPVQDSLFCIVLFIVGNIAVGIHQGFRFRKMVSRKKLQYSHPAQAQNQIPRPESRTYHHSRQVDPVGEDKGIITV